MHACRSMLKVSVVLRTQPVAKGCRPLFKSPQTLCCANVLQMPSPPNNAHKTAAKTAATTKRVHAPKLSRHAFAVVSACDATVNTPWHSTLHSACGSHPLRSAAVVWPLCCSGCILGLVTMFLKFCDCGFNQQDSLRAIEQASRSNLGSITKKSRGPPAAAAAAGIAAASACFQVAPHQQGRFKHAWERPLHRHSSSWPVRA